jgi:RHS repeat-associated protein
VWDGNTPLHEWLEPAETGPTSERQVTTWVFEANSSIPAARLAGGTYQNVVTDHLGTPLEMHSSRGELVWAAEFDAYGAVRRQQGDGQDCPLCYQGQYEDVETGLYYNRFRYYDSHAGQYISQDPIGLAGSFTAYGYVTDPLIYTDVLGLSQAYYLEKALNAAGLPLQPGQTAHHIVQLTNPSTYATQSRALLARNGLNPDVAANGARLWGTHPNQVALPTHPGVTAARAAGNYHAGPHIHSPINDKRVFRALEHAENNGLSITGTLEDIGRQMESGTWKACHTSCIP